MRKSLFGLTALVLLAGAAPCADADTGVGIIVGDPTGVSVLIEERIAVGAAWALGNYLHVHADAWVLDTPVADTLDLYVGLGGKVVFVGLTGGAGPFEERDPDATTGLGFRLPAGLQLYLPHSLELFFEAAPGMFVLPATRFSLDAGLGIRIHL